MTTVDTTADTLLALDAHIDETASDGDFAGLDPLLAEDFIYAHSTGAVQTKTEWVDSLKPLVGKRRRVVSGARAELHGDVAIVAGDVDIVWNDRETKLNRYIRVYRQQEHGAWQAISQRTVPAPDRSGK
jgi:hypothetical protein